MTSLQFLLLCACVTLVVAKSTEMYELKNAELHFEHFIQKYERHYADEMEKRFRFQIFKDNLEKANSLNEESNSAVFGITQFSDVTTEEFRKYYTGLRRPTVTDYKQDCTYVTDDGIPDVDVPESFDWRDQNVVTPVKDQKKCGSCYAFSSIGNIESLYAIKNKKLLDLSEQQIVDCDKRNYHCGGGYMSSAFRSLIEQGGAESEADYPYIMITDNCHFDASKVQIKLADCRSYNLTSQEKLKQLLYQNGPISIAIRHEGLRHYTSGILSDKLCDVGRIDHAVLLVGYGSENGELYWLAKNSWNESFGEHGYFRFHRGEGAKSCSMLNDMMASAILA